MFSFPQKQFHAVIQGDVRKALAQLPDGLVDCVVSSPPYWGLRDYKIEPTVWGGSEVCEHEWGSLLAPIHKGQVPQSVTIGRPSSSEGGNSPTGQFCSCGAWKGQLGLEPTFQLYVQHIVEVFHQLRRVLKKSGSLWLNLGDTYNNDPSNSGDSNLGNAEGLD